MNIVLRGKDKKTFRGKVYSSLLELSIFGGGRELTPGKGGGGKGLQEKEERRRRE